MAPELPARELETLEEGETVADVMTREVTTIPPETTLDEVAHLMVIRQLIRLPVVDLSGVLLGRRVHLHGQPPEGYNSHNRMSPW